MRGVTPDGVVDQLRTVARCANGDVCGSRSRASPWAVPDDAALRRALETLGRFDRCGTRHRSRGRPVWIGSDDERNPLGAAATGARRAPELARQHERPVVLHVVGARRMYAQPQASGIPRAGLQVHGFWGSRARRCVVSTGRVSFNRSGRGAARGSKRAAARVDPRQPPLVESDALSDAPHAPTRCLGRHSVAGRHPRADRIGCRGSHSRKRAPTLWSG